MTETRAPYHTLDLTPRRHVREVDVCPSCEDWRLNNPPGAAFFKQYVADGCTKGTLERVWQCESCGQQWWKFRRIER